MRIAILAVTLLSASAGAKEYALEDKGDFMPVGHRIEFADRYGWRAYKARFEFGLESSGRGLSKSSKLTLTVAKRDGSDWTYTCRAKGKSALSANINFLHGKGISVVAECRIDEEDFADAVGLHKDDVGHPYLVFHAVIKDGEVVPGAQRGLYFVPAGHFETSELNAYASNQDDPSNLSIVFRSN